ncbi:short-chain dehydrogenase [Pisolithus sp. B1]|nr:short-chain dehydrogenase [Pisolithus sp. B1]
MAEILRVLRFLYDQRWQPLPIPTTSDDVSSKVFMVVGSNTGIGLEASVFLARQKPKLLVATSRDSTKCKLTREAILERTDLCDGEGSAVETWPLEMSSFDSVRAIADRLATREDSQLNVVVANAGVILDEFDNTQDGWELTLQVNYLSTALLSLLLLPYLVKSSTAGSPSRLVIVSSVAHYNGTDSLKKAKTWDRILETINSREFAKPAERYCVSKLFSMMFVRELEARLPYPTPVIVCAVDPGLCYTRMLLKSPAKSLTWFSRTPEVGSRTLLHAAIGDEGRAMHGRYMSSCKVGAESTYIASPEGKEFSQRLWNETIQLLSQIDSRVPEITEKYLRNI